ncbi:unnamed protein product [Clonostachys rosea f. rosea IK726]|uniref:Uncharacterized protein n=2 Tax=Bionectria ochroleuca TaxID=29856 RepID=A0A0B7KAY2_BIOOC|nr:unnamed protein product [Clonostachys rosea f. rosea IK726]
MPTAAERAKAKYQAVIDNPNRNDASNYKNRMMTTSHPSGGCDVTNSVTRRPSQGSQNSDHGQIRKMVKNWMSRPAF